MAFGGVNDLTLLNENAGAGGRNVCVGRTLTLAATTAGLLVSDVPGVGETGLPVNFGPGRGNWTAADLDRVTVVTSDATGATSLPKETARTFIAGGNVSIQIENQGAGACDDLSLRLIYEHSAIL